jgi:amidase
MDIANLDVLSATAADLRDLLQAKQASSVQLVKAYLSQIARHDVALKAFICLAPEQDVIASASLLDKERLEGRVRSQLHGIPIVVKVRSSCESQTRF